MLILVTGGSGSGKSEFAEGLAVSFQRKPLVYIATMVPFDEETEQKIKRHQRMREKKEFETVECFVNIESISGWNGSVILLECLSNLLANEMYRKDGAGEDSIEKVMNGIMHLKNQAEHVIVVSNEVFSDGITYDAMTMEYIRNLGKINSKLGEIADQVIEVVYTIPIFHKGQKG